jgi:hypothetical protein
VVRPAWVAWAACNRRKSSFKNSIRPDGVFLWTLLTSRCHPPSLAVFLRGDLAWV